MSSVGQPGARGGPCVDFGSHQGFAHARVGREAGVDNDLVGAPCDLECGVLLDGEHVG